MNIWYYFESVKQLGVITSRQVIWSILEFQRRQSRHTRTHKI